MRNLFNSVPRPPIRYNKFNLSSPNFFTADYGILYPCLCREVNGGEVMRDFTESMVRTMPMRCPAFVRCDSTVHYFFVPNRLIYEDWTKFIVRGDDGNTDYDKPYIEVDAFKDLGLPIQLFCNGSLMDYLNFPTFPVNQQVLPGSDAKVDLLPFNAYSLIYNEYYRDENLIPEVYIWKMSGYANNLQAWEDHYTQVLADMDDPTAQATITQAKRLTFPMELRRRAWRKDYFTSALPFVQKGTPISLAGGVTSSTGEDFVALRWFGSHAAPAPNTRFLFKWFADGSSEGHGGFPYLSATNIIDDPVVVPNPTSPANPSLYGVYPILDLSQLQSSVMTISDLRVGLALQQWFELNARTGSDRYFEYLLGHFGVRDRDARLQRPEYLGGFSSAVQISEVEQTSQTSSTSPQGNLAGKGVGFSASHPVRYRFPEPGWLMAIFSIRPHAVYYQGLPRQYNRWDAFDYFDPLFDHLSEQPIWQSELDFDWSIIPGSSDDKVFGYTPRFSEYRTALAECHGDFRETLNYWISPRQFSSPELNRDFIEVNGYDQQLYQHYAFPGTAQSPSAHFYVHMQHNISMLRPMSKYATPKL